MNNNFKYKLFGRFRGRKKNQKLFSSDINAFNLDISEDLILENYNILDIGSGSGENALFQAKSKPSSKIITCEIFEDGNINLLNKIILDQIKNIYLYKGNVLEFFDQIKQTPTFDEVWILFPDPWPKQRHHKRRLLNKNFLNLIINYLKIGGKLFIASDSQSYILSIIENIYDSQDFFLWKNQSVEEWNYENLKLPSTKFYKKAIKSNRNTMFFELHKI